MGKSNITYFKEVGGWVWNPITGCSGTGCAAHCYAKDIVRRFPAIHGVMGKAIADPPGIPFNIVRFHPERLSEPLKRKKPTVWGVGFFGDMFDEQAKDEWLDEIFCCAFIEAHQFVFLTKQPKRMHEYVTYFVRNNLVKVPSNWYFGTTVTTQAEADERIPELLKVPGKKWLSLEPLLGPIDFSSVCIGGPDVRPWCDVDLVVVGGESGPKARPMHPQWARDIRDQCSAAGVPYYHKQNGEWVPMIPTDNELRKNIKRDWAHFEDRSFMKRVGLKAAGRLLDGALHDDLPWRKA